MYITRKVWLWRRSDGYMLGKRKDLYNKWEGSRWIFIPDEELEHFLLLYKMTKEKWEGKIGKFRYKYWEKGDMWIIKRGFGEIILTSEELREAALAIYEFEKSLIDVTISEND